MPENEIHSRSAAVKKWTIFEICPFCLVLVPPVFSLQISHPFRRVFLLCFILLSMSQTPVTDIWGSDIALDESNQAIVAANGELVLTIDVATGVQDIKLRLFTYFGTLFYDKSYGSRVFDFVYGENTAENRAAFLAEVERCVEADPRVVPYSVKASILKWNESQLIASVRWTFIDADQPNNLVLQASKEIKELLIKDMDADSAKLLANVTEE